MPAQFERRGQARLLAAVVILGAWSTGLTLLVRREFFQGRPQRLAEAALRLSPSATFFAMEQRGKVIGFASTTIDTIASGIDAVDYTVVDSPSASGTGIDRTSTRSVVKLTRGLSLKSFDTQVDSRSAPAHTGGRADGDSGIVFVKFTGTQPTDSQRIAVHGPVVLPAIVPVVVALGERPKIGRRYTMPVFDPASVNSNGAAEFTIGAESLFALVDSARFDQREGDWIAALTDTVRAWRLDPAAPAAGPTEWIDAQGRVVQAERPDGIVLKRTAYELAFENWRIARDRATAAHAGTGDILERTAIAAGASVGRSTLRSMSVQLGAPRFTGYDLDGGRQRFVGDTLKVVREDVATFGKNAPSIRDMHAPEFKRQFHAELDAEPLLQIHDLEIVQLAIRIVGLERNPRAMAEKVNQWVHDSVADVATSAPPSAVAVARSRRGDCYEHTQLFVALTRVIGIPTRIASGLLYVNGKFYYHTWPEIWLGDWAAVDPTFGQFPADAGHLRFVLGGISRQTELLQLLGNLTIKVVEAK